MCFERHTKNGREPCASKREPVEQTSVKRAGVDWIKEHPKEFAFYSAGIAQMMNPHFLARHLRWGNMRSSTLGDEESLL